MKTNKAVWVEASMPELRTNMVVSLFNAPSAIDYLIIEPDNMGRTWQCIQSYCGVGGMYKYHAGCLPDINIIYDSLHDWKRNAPSWTRKNTPPSLKQGMVIARGPHKQLYLIVMDLTYNLHEVRLEDNIVFIKASNDMVVAIWKSYEDYIRDQMS
jgi:hypothetical protein